MDKFSRRSFVKMAGLVAAAAVMPGFSSDEIKKAEAKEEELTKAEPGTGGDHYDAPQGRQGGESVVYFTRDLSAAGLLKLYEKIAPNITGRVGIKLHTGEPHGPNIIPRPWVTESSKATVDHFGDHIAYINVLRNMSVDCDCAGTTAAKPTVPNIGILASTDILAIDQASVDLVYALPEHYRHDLVERMETRHGLRQLSYMKELGMGRDRYVLLDCDHGEKPITLADAVSKVKPFR